MKRINVLALTLSLAVLVCMPMYAQNGHKQNEGTTTYTFQTINFPNDTFTQLLGINNSDVIAGYHGANVNKGFTLVLRGLTFTSENFTNSRKTQVIGLNNSSATHGFYIDGAGLQNGFKDLRGPFLLVD